MKSLCEKSTNRVIDWNAELDKAIEQGFISNELIVASEDWVTCACGNLCDAIPRTKHDSPKDDRLFRLGLDFMNQVGAGDVEGAKETLEDIEIRSMEILTLMGLTSLAE